MTVGELEDEIVIHLTRDTTREALKTLIADWREMRNVLLELVDTDSDRAFERCALVLNTLNLKP